MTTKHTKGPWYVASMGSDPFDQGLVTSEKTGENIAVTYKAENARLIAAAPDMLEALEVARKYAYDHISGFGVREGNEAAQVYNIIRAAIAKATEAE